MSRNLTKRTDENYKNTGTLFNYFRYLLDYGTESRNRTDTPEGNGF